MKRVNIWGYLPKTNYGVYAPVEVRLDSLMSERVNCKFKNGGHGANSLFMVDLERIDFFSAVQNVGETTAYYLIIILQSGGHIVLEYLDFGDYVEASQIMREPLPQEKITDTFLEIIEEVK